MDIRNLRIGLIFLSKEKPSYARTFVMNLHVDIPVRCHPTGIKLPRMSWVGLCCIGCFGSGVEWPTPTTGSNCDKIQDFVLSAY